MRRFGPFSPPSRGQFEPGRLDGQRGGHRNDGGAQAFEAGR
jgi:hypothetical protein